MAVHDETPWYPCACGGEHNTLDCPFGYPPTAAVESAIEPLSESSIIATGQMLKKHVESVGDSTKEGLMRTWDVTVAIIIEADTEEDAREQADLECANSNATVLDVEEIPSQSPKGLIQKVIIRKFHTTKDSK